MALQREYLPEFIEGETINEISAGKGSMNPL